jgi:hypothetical protein
MRASEFIDEKINPETVNTGFRDRQSLSHDKLGNLTITAEGETRLIGTTKANVLHLRLLDSENKELAWADFLVKTRKEDDEQWLESAYTYVNPKYRGYGLSKLLYQYANNLGNDIAPSGLQTDLGKGMWKGLTKSVRQPEPYINPKPQKSKSSLWQRIKKNIMPDLNFK